MKSIKIPNKSHFKIDEVCGLIGIKPYVLRFWESEFPEVSPMVSSSGQKLFEPKDIEVLLYIKKLLTVDKLTVERAKREVTRFALLNKENSRPVQSSAKVFPSKRPLAKKITQPMSMASKNEKPQLSVDVQKIILVKEKLKGMINLADNLLN